MEAKETKHVADAMARARVTITRVRLAADKAVLEAQEVDEVEHARSGKLIAVRIEGLAVADQQCIVALRGSGKPINRYA